MGIREAIAGLQAGTAHVSCCLPALTGQPREAYTVCATCDFAWCPDHRAWHAARCWRARMEAAWLQPVEEQQ